MKQGLTFYDAPGVQTASHPLAFGFHHCVASNYCKRNAFLMGGGTERVIKLTNHCIVSLSCGEERGVDESVVVDGWMQHRMVQCRCVYILRAFVTVLMSAPSHRKLQHIFLNINYNFIHFLTPPLSIFNVMLL